MSAEDEPMSAWLTISRGVLFMVGTIALLLAGGNLLTGGAPITDPAMPFGLAFGALTIGAATWTRSPVRWQAAVVWLGVLAIVAAFIGFVVSLGDAALRDVLVYFGIPATIVLVSTLAVVIARVRAGAFGSYPEEPDTAE